MGRGGMIGDSRRYDNSRLAIHAYALRAVLPTICLCRPVLRCLCCALPLLVAPTGMPNLLFTLHVYIVYDLRPSVLLCLPSFLFLLLPSLPSLPLQVSGKDMNNTPAQIYSHDAIVQPNLRAYQSQTYYRNKRSRTIQGLGGVPHPP
mgnify:CR=1 FL=1